jgi:hypothetical protein
VKRIKSVGLDVPAETIAVAVAEQDGEIRSGRHKNVILIATNGDESRTKGEQGRKTLGGKSNRAEIKGVNVSSTSPDVGRFS